MNTATEASVRKTVSSRTSTNLNSLPEAADTKTNAAIAGTKPASSIRTPNRIREKGSRISARSDRWPWIFSPLPHPDRHDANTEYNEYPAQDDREEAGPHAQRAAESVFPGDEHRSGADCDQHHPGPEILVLAQLHLHAELLTVQRDLIAGQAAPVQPTEEWQRPVRYAGFYLTLMLASLTTLPHLTISFSMKGANSAGAT